MSIISKASALAVVCIGLLAGTARADGLVSVDVPFPFLVGHTEFPAGRYEIRKNEEAGTVLAIEGVNNRHMAFVLTTPAEGGDPAVDQPALVFIESEHTYTLSEIWESPNEGHVLPGASAAGKIARAEMPTGPADKGVLIVAKAR